MGDLFASLSIVLDPAFNTYMDIQEEINFAILDHFRREGISIAYPTRTLHMAAA